MESEAGSQARLHPILAAEPEEQSRLQLAALEAAANAIFITDRSGAIQWANPAFERLTGYSTAEVLGKNPRFLKSAQRQEPGFFRQMWETILAGQVWRGELVNRRKDGSRYHEEMTITPVRDRAGVVTHFVAIKQDISERKAAEEARAKLAAVVEFSGDAILSKDLQGKVTSWNRAAQRLLGWAPEEIIGQPISLIVPPELEREEAGILERVRRGESIDHYETVRVSKAGRRIEVLVTIAPVRNESGSVVGACKTIRDITERKQAERALRQARDELAQANAELEHRVQERTAKLQEAVTELEQLSYSMIHDLRAPLRAIQSFAGILQEDPESHLSQEGRELVWKVRTAAHRLDQLIVDVLNYSKVLRGDLPLGPVDAGALARGIVETYPHLGAAHAEVRVAPQLPWVVGNEAALTQCLSQLLSNAVKFVPPGQVARVAVTSEPRDHGWVRLVVEDNGIGIPPEFQGKVFGMFQRGNNSGEGTGMGLAIVKKTAERMGGRVGVESEPGKGSRFWVELRGVSEAGRNPPPGGAHTPAVPAPRAPPAS